MSTEKATLHDGRVLEFNRVPDPPAGGMKMTYFAPDRSYVVQFFHDAATGKDPQRLERLKAILTKYNPTISEAQGGAKGSSETAAKYFQKLFCWPTAIVMKPQVGIVAPTYPSAYFFQEGQFKGQEKEGTWFVRSKLRKMLPPSELGSWINYFKLCILMSRAVRRLHQAGLAHSDLSCRNILVDPSGGTCVVIDIDSLVVPQLYPPDVLGTPGYIAPEVLETLHLPLLDPKRRHPCISTDDHALAVLLYQYLLFRHPLMGPKTYPASSAEEQERLEMGEKSLFIEHPTDKSNRPTDLQIQCSALGPQLNDLFMRAFVKGLHSPNDRPTAADWERGLIKTWDILHPCDNQHCSHRWFVLCDPTNPKCPFCGTKVKGTIPFLELRTERRQGNWLPDGRLVVYNGQSIFKWHILADNFPGEEADRTPMGYFAFVQGRWLLINQAMTSLTSPSGNLVPPGQAVVLNEGAQIRLSQEAKGRMAIVQTVKS